MTGLLHEKELSRRSFVKGGGMLTVGFSLAGAGLGGKAHAAAPTAAGYNPDPNQVDSWLTIGVDNTATLNTSQIETGNGIMTGFLMIAAEELNMDMSQMRFGPDDTYVVVASGGEGGSNAIAGTGPNIRAAAVTARQTLLRLASQHLGVPMSSLHVSAGVVTGDGKSVTYGELLGGKLFNVSMPPRYNMAAVAGFGPPTGLPAGQPPAKPIARYSLVGTSPPRIDIPAKVTGAYTYVQNVHVPGMLHGRVVRPRGQGAWGSDAPIVSIDPRSISHIPNVRIVRKGQFLGVVAPLEWDAIQAAAELKVVWKDDPVLSGTGNLFGAMRSEKTRDALQTSTGNLRAGLASAAKVLSQTYSYGYNGHLPIGPMCCVADVGPKGATIFSSTQDIEALSSTVANTLGMQPAQVRVKYYEGSGSYGSNTQEDVAESAALMSRIVGKPVRVQFMRWDEHGWDAYGPAHTVHLTAGIDRHGRIVGYGYTGWQIPYFTIFPPDEFVGMPIPDPTQGFTGYGFIDTSNTGGQYEIPNLAVTSKAVPALHSRYFKVTFLRAPSSQQALFASEQMIDELAHAARLDPVAFRRLNIATSSDPAAGSPGGGAWIGVLDAVANAADWKPKVAASNLGTGGVVTGRGIALGGFASTQVGVVADIQVDKKTGRILVTHLYASQINGLTISPGLVENQMSGNLIQGLSRGLYEQVTFDRNRVTSLDWATYPILRFKQSPKVTTVSIQRKDLPSTGSGEPVNAPVAAAVANAFFDATGVRIRVAPMTAARVRSTLKAAGVA
jgi:CO/xanthine dehydrogenase Mo-binding subunit